MDPSSDPTPSNLNYVKINDDGMDACNIHFAMYIRPFIVRASAILQSPVSAYLCYSLDRPAKSARTVMAARAPSSMAPSMKLRHPNAQSEHANTMLRSLALISFKCVDIKPGAGKNLQLQLTTLTIGSI